MATGSDARGAGPASRGRARTSCRRRHMALPALAATLATDEATRLGEPGGKTLITTTYTESIARAPRWRHRSRKEPRVDNVKSTMRAIGTRLAELRDHSHAGAAPRGSCRTFSSQKDQPEAFDPSARDQYRCAGSPELGDPAPARDVGSSLCWPRAMPPGRRPALHKTFAATDEDARRL